MERYIYKQLKEWQLSAKRKPLVMYGARQVGKTYILQAFGKEEFDDMVYVNCYKNDVVAQLFSGDVDVDRLLLGLSAISHKKIVAGRTLMFFDEVQEVPAVVSALKYFCEEKPDLHVAVAGSLLGVMNMHGESFPVGKVDIMRLYPMSFEEFLLALGQRALVDILQSCDWSLLSALHPKLEQLLREYYYVGGMPEAVARYIADRDLAAVRRIQNNILHSYEADIAKHTAEETQRVRMVWQSIPSQLAKENKKFVYGAVRKGARAKDFELAIQWLVDAGIVHKVERTRNALTPLKFYADAGTFKLYLLDVGLLGAMTDVGPERMLVDNSAMVEYKGAFTENFVICQLRTLSPLPTYYYSKDNSTMEVDFVVQSPRRIIPVEVKAEVNVKSKSLFTFVCHDFKSCNLKGLRLSMLPYRDQEWMENIPLYAIRAYMSAQL